MSDPQTLEEAYEELFATAARIPLASPAEFQSAVRALLLVGLEEAIDTSPRIKDMPDLRYRIEELGR